MGPEMGTSLCTAGLAGGEHATLELLQAEAARGGGGGPGEANQGSSERIKKQHRLHTRQQRKYGDRPGTNTKAKVSHNHKTRKK